MLNARKFFGPGCCITIKHRCVALLYDNNFIELILSGSIIVNKYLCTTGKQGDAIYKN